MLMMVNTRTVKSMHRSMILMTMVNNT